MPKPDHDLSILLYCRSGFEADCAAEAQAVWGEDFGAKEVHCERGEAFVVVHIKGFPQALAYDEAFDLSRLIFARQLIVLCGQVQALAASDRAGPVAACLEASKAWLPEEVLYSKLLVEGADTNEGKKLQKFCKQFELPLSNRLKKQGFKKVFSRQDYPSLHVFFPNYDSAFVGVSFPTLQASAHPMGIIRLKFPNEAPSRSTLKLEEAFHCLLTHEERQAWLQGGLKAVDLGASPGGWTYQLLRRGIQVTAVDNGMMADNLYELGELKHRREDAFKFTPAQAVHWLVCDMVEQPQKVAKLVGDWFAKGWCRLAIVNLKLPMKKRLQELDACLELIAKRGGLARDLIRAKHLYHDRDEVTLFIKNEESARGPQRGAPARTDKSRGAR